MRTGFPASARTREKAVPHDPAPMTAISAIAFLAFLADRVDIDGFACRLLAAHLCLPLGNAPHEFGPGLTQDGFIEWFAGVRPQVAGLADANDNRLSGQSFGGVG